MPDFAQLLANEFRAYKEATDARLLELEKFKETYTQPDTSGAKDAGAAAAPSSDKKPATPAA